MFTYFTLSRPVQSPHGVPLVLPQAAAKARWPSTCMRTYTAHTAHTHAPIPTVSWQYARCGTEMTESETCRLPPPMYVH
ncbi:hypothetical protein LZ31DRAFT_81641 [Colletotrichum somersetense]|nr:hypothetical protein LZ31DRAFT_81641 [Colletotrichum somersetense]